MDAREETVDACLETVDARLETVDACLETVDMRVDTVDACLETVDMRVDTVNMRVDGVVAGVEADRSGDFLIPDSKTTRSVPIFGASRCARPGIRKSPLLWGGSQCVRFAFFSDYNH